MNSFKKPVEKVKEKKVTKPSSPSLFISILNGSFLSRDQVLQQVPYIVFLALIAIFYIANTFYAEKSIRQINSIGNELKELRSEYITTKSDLMFISKQSEVSKTALSMGIKESTTQPHKLSLER